MKFFHISDLHIGKQLYGYSLLEDQVYVLEQILKEAQKEKPDALLITGDIYDKPVPGAEAVAVFDRFLTGLSRSCPAMQIMVIAGNHDAARRIDYAGDILCQHGIHIVGTPLQRPGDQIRRVTMEDAYGAVDFYLLPFFKPGNLRGVFTEEENTYYVNRAKEEGRSEYEIYLEALLGREDLNASRRKVLLTHQFFVPGDGEKPERTESEIITVGTLDHISAHLLSAFDYVAMGHLHRPQKCGRENIRYCGTPMPYSLSEEKDHKSITVVTLGLPGQEAQVETIALTPLRRVRKLRGSVKELIALAQQEGKMSDQPGKAGQKEINDYVSLVVTDEEPGRYVREQLGMYYSHILEIRFDNRFMQSLMEDQLSEGLSEDYFEMFRSFYEMRNGAGMSGEEAEIFAKLLDETKGGEA